MRSGNTAQIVGFQDSRCPIEKGEATYVRAQPVAKFLRSNGFGAGVAGCPEGCHEDLGLMDFPGLTVDDRYGLAGLIDKQLSPAQCSWRVTT